MLGAAITLAIIGVCVLVLSMFGGDGTGNDSGLAAFNMGCLAFLALEGVALVFLGIHFLT